MWDLNSNIVYEYLYKNINKFDDLFICLLIDYKNQNSNHIVLCFYIYDNKFPTLAKTVQDSIDSKISIQIVKKLSNTA